MKYLLFVFTLLSTVASAQVQSLHGNYVDWGGDIQYKSMDVHITQSKIVVVDKNVLYIQPIASVDTLDMSEFYTKVRYVTDYGNQFIVEYNPIGIETVDFILDSTTIKIREIFYEHSQSNSSY
jgi:hypothetical protein